MEKCLQTKGLDTFGIGKVRHCLLNAGASDIAAADEARLQSESQVSLCSLVTCFLRAGAPMNLLLFISLSCDAGCRAMPPAHGIHLEGDLIAFALFASCLACDEGCRAISPAHDITLEGSLIVSALVASL